MNGEKAKATIVVMGAPTLYSNADDEEMREVISDINKLEPDIVMLLGDYGNTTEGFSHGILSELKGKLLPALGNHNLQAKDGSTDEEKVELLFVRDFGLERHYYSFYHNELLFITLSNEQWRQPNEVFLGEEQLDWLDRTLSRNPTTPTIVQCHVPIYGTRIPLAPTVHVRATNAYVNHNHNPERLLQLIGRHPQIILWFSGHSHLGQSHKNAITYHSGVYFVHVGVCRQHFSRDGHVHSRVVVLDENRINIRTFDHAKHTIAEELDYIIESGPRDLMSSWEVSTRSGYLSGKIDGIHVSDDGLQLEHFPTVDYLEYQDAPVSSYQGAICVHENKVYVATTGGYVWEYDKTTSSALGALYIGKQPTVIVADDEYVWIGGGDGYIQKVPANAPERFIRRLRTDYPGEIIKLKGVVRAIDKTANTLFVGADRRLYEIDLNTHKVKVKSLFRGDVLAIAHTKEYLYVSTADGKISCYDVEYLQPQGVYSTNVAFDFMDVVKDSVYLASSQTNEVVKASPGKLVGVNKFKLNGKLQAVCFDDERIYVLTNLGKLVCIETGVFTLVAQRQLDMNKATAMAADDKHLYVASEVRGERTQEIHVLSKKSNLTGTARYFIRTAEEILPLLEVDAHIPPHSTFTPELRAKVRGKWYKFDEDTFPSREFEVRISLSKNNANDSLIISRIKLKGQETEEQEG